MRNDNSVKFWQDPWLAAGIILQDHINTPRQLPHWDATIGDMCSDIGEWNWPNILPLISHEISALIAGTETPIPEAGEDITTWGLEADEKF
ncbi:unnamed protein product [Linum trigynum]|uniref:Uncharacterized protein n=1 Tax=Linum trigynum TaxID=586398 RepID=A0AAV2D036_9ROSI